MKLTRAGRPAVLALLAIATSLVVACGGRSDSSAGANSTSQSTAFTDACLASTNMTPAICECLDAKAQTELSNTERTFVIASLQEDSATTNKLRGELTLEGAVKAGMFMTRAGSCAAGKS